MKSPVSAFRLGLPAVCLLSVAFAACVRAAAPVYDAHGFDLAGVTANHDE